MWKTLSTREGAEIAYQSVGDGPSLLFIHNGGTSSTIWRHQVAELSSRYRAIVVDLPGFGSAARGRSGTKRDAQVKLLGSVLDALSAEEVLVVGNCMGSNLAVGLAESRPERVRALVLINPLTEQTFTHGWLGVLRLMRRLRWLARIVRVVPPKPAAVMALRLQLGEKGLAKKLHHDAELLLSNQRRDQLPALIDVLVDMPSYGRMDQPRSTSLPPVCTMWGAQNKILSARAGEHLNDLLRVERAEILPGCGHLPMLEDPEAVTGVIDDLARAHLSRAPSSRRKDTTYDLADVDAGGEDAEDVTPVFAREAARAEGVGDRDGSVANEE